MKRGKFSLSYTKLLSCDMGELVPIGWHEALPGDTIQQSTSALVRCAPLLSPVMHPVEVRFHHWFVPNRLLWDNWEKFITGGPDGLDATVHPTITLPSVAVGSLADYLGVPISAGAISVSALPFRAYASIFNENYRDQDLVTLAGLSVADGVDATTSTALKNIAWEKDSYTSARPWEQKGPAISIPLTGTAPVRMYEGAAPYPGSGARTAQRAGAAAGQNIQVVEGGGGTGTAIRWDANPSGASAVTVNALREALALQRYEEARARFGSRYTEYLLYLGVKSADSRLQRPEYLGGGRQTIQFSEVLATAETGATVDVGDMKGHGIAAMKSNRYRRYFEEHGICMTMMSVRPKTMYMQGLARPWNRRTKEDYWQKELQHIGQDNILNCGS